MPLRVNLPLLATVLSWGFNFVALKLLYAPDQMTPPSVGLVRFILMYALLMALCSWRRESLKYPLGDSLRILFLGFLAMGIYMVFFLEGMKTSTAAEGAIILATSPIFTALLAAAAGQEKFNVGALIGALIAFTGVVVVILAGVQGHLKVEGKLLGNLLILTSSVIWAASTVYSRPLVEKYSPLRVLTLSMPGALPILLPYGLAASFAVDWAHLQPVTWAMLFHIAVLAGVLGFAGFYEGVKQIGAPGAMLYQYLVPPTATLCAWAVFGQAMQPLQFVGLVVVLSGVAVAMHHRLQAAKKAIMGQAPIAP